MIRTRAEAESILEILLDNQVCQSAQEFQELVLDYLTGEKHTSEFGPELLKLAEAVQEGIDEKTREDAADHKGDYDTEYS